MAKDKLYTLHQISEILDVPIPEIEWYVKKNLVNKSGKKDRKGNLLISEDQFQQVYDLYSNRYSYVSDDELDNLVYGYC